MTQPDENAAEAIVDRAVAALGRVELPAGPSPQAIAESIAAARGAASQSRFTLTERIFPMARRHRTALATGGLATGALAATIALLWLLPASPSLALEQAVEKLRASKNISFLVEHHSANPKTPVSNTRVWLMEPDKSRSEFDTSRGKVIMTRSDQKMLQLDSRTKLATELEVPAGAMNSPRKPLDELQSIVEKEARSLGEKEIGGVLAKGFEATIKERKITLWANAKTGDLIRIEYPLIQIPPPEGPGLQVLTDFKFDEKFDPEMFSVVPPADYKVEKFEPIPIEPIKQIVAMLRAYSEEAEGAFPPRIDDGFASITEKLGIPKEAAKRTAEQKQLMAGADALAVFLRSAKEGKLYRYYPGVKLGEKDRVVFWCIDPPITGTFVTTIPHVDAAPPPKPEPQKYLAVYGDLRTEMLKEDQLPKAP